MSFGRNPYLPKAQAAEQKAVDASDSHARAQAYREAAHEWDRAAARETPGKRRTEYEQNATRNRELADAGDEADAPALDSQVASVGPALRSQAAPRASTQAPKVAPHASAQKAKRDLN